MLFGRLIKMNSIFITDSMINKVTGGGVVSLNMIESLRDFGLSSIFCMQKQPDNRFMGIPSFSINPIHWGYNYYSPFFKDYLAYHLIPKEKIDLCVSYGCPFGLTMEDLKKEDVKIVCDLPPHKINISQEEHIKFTGEYNHPHLTDEVLWGLYSRHLRYADKVITHSDFSAEYIQKQAKLREKPISIPHGCYLPENIPEYPEQVTPGYFGSIGLDKGTIYLANAWLNTPHKPEVQMILGGRDAKDFQLEQVEHMKNFKTTGFLENLSEFYKQISIYTHPSVTEGFGCTVLEAMAYGRPVIVTEETGAKELITDGKEGFIIPIRDINKIIEYIRYFQDNPDVIKTMGRNARQTAEKYTWEIIKKYYIEAFRSLL